MDFKLVKQSSKRVNEKGEPFLDLYLCWTYEKRVYYVRVKPQFSRDYKLMLASATEVPSNEPIEKYL